MIRRAVTLALCTLAAAPAWPEPVPARPAPRPAEQAAAQPVAATQLQFRTVHAIEQNRLDLALQLALSILEADPEDSFGHMAMATVLMRGGRPDQARLAAGKAYRAAQSPRQKHEAARVAALANAREARFLPAQLWMRRAHQAAPDAATRRRSEQEYRIVRNRARLGFQLSAALAPSSNVNNGAADRYNVVDGLPVVGLLPPASQALSGTVGTLGLQASYRLRDSARSRTSLIGGGQIKRVWLSREARDDAPEVENRDFGSTYGELGLLHQHALPERFGTLSLGASLGQAWSGGTRNYTVGSAKLGLSLPLASDSAVSLTGYAQRRFDDAQDLPDVETLGGRLTLSHAVANGDRLSLSLSHRVAASENRQARSHARGAELTYDKAQPIGPLSLSLSAGFEETTYPDYHILFFPVEGGRRDRQTSAKLDLRIDKMTYMGFAPVVSIATEKTRSNVSRFETEELSVSLGLRSAF